MVKIEFTGSVEEVKKEIREFIEVSSIGVTAEGLATSIKENLETEAKVEEKTTVNVEKAPTQKLPTAPAKKVEDPVEVATLLPTKTAEYTAEDLQKIAAEWVKKDVVNNRPMLINLLASFEVKAITFLPKEKYGAFVQELKNLGADV